MNNFRNTLLISANELKNANTLISGNVDDDVLSSTILTCQEVYLESITGTALYHKLQQLVFNQITNVQGKINDPANDSYKTLLDECIKPFLKARCTVDVLYNIAFKIRNNGVVKSNDTNIQNVDIDDIKYLEKQYSTYVDEYSQRLSKYLCYNKELFPELTADIPSYFDQPTMGKDYANTGLWLGKKKNRTCGC